MKPMKIGFDAGRLKGDPRNFLNGLKADGAFAVVEGGEHALAIPMSCSGPGGFFAVLRVEGSEDEVVLSCEIQEWPMAGGEIKILDDKDWVLWDKSWAHGQWPYEGFVKSIREYVIPLYAAIQRAKERGEEWEVGEAGLL